MHPQSISPELQAELAAAAMVRPNGKPRATIDSDWAINYARQSTSVQDSYEGQWHLNDKTAKKLQLNPTMVVRLYDIQSGLDADRAGYQELLRLARTRKYGHILLYAADRLARDDGEFIDVCEELLAMGIRLWQYNDDEITTRNVHELGSKAYAESRKTANRTQDGMEIRAAKGVKLGHTMLGYVHKEPPGFDKNGRWQRYGYTEDGKPDQFDVHPVIGPAITTLYERCAAGESLQTLRLWFNEMTGIKLRAHNLKHILRHEYYCGLIIGCKRRHSKLDGNDPRPKEEWQHATHNKPLTDPQTWKQVQARLDSQAVEHPYHAAHERTVPSRFALTGLTWCAQCNTRTWGNQAHKNSANYKCPLCNKGKSTRMVERAVADTLTHLVINMRETARDIAELMTTTRHEIENRLANAHAELDKVQEHRTNWAMMWNAKQIDGEQYNRGKARYDRQSDELGQQIRDLEKRLQHMPAHLELAQFDIERLPTDMPLHAALMLWPTERAAELYKTCIKRVVVDAPANKARIEYVDHLAPVWGAATEVTLSRKRS